METVEKATGLLRELQLKNIDILLQIDSFCREHDIKYSLIAGSIIGAIVHKGIIPWDDDIDIAMDRVNFDKFRGLALDKLPKPLSYSDFLIDKSQLVLLGRVIDKSTTCVTKDQYGRIRIGGVFIDITVFDVVPANFVQRKLQYLCSMYALLLVNGKAPENHGKLMQCGGRLLLKLNKPAKRQEKVGKLIEKLKKYKRAEKTHMSEIIYHRGNKILYSNNLFDKYIEVPFENISVPVIAEYDAYIRTRYNRDYHIIPPVSERNTHRDIQFLSFDIGYEQYIAAGQCFAAGEFISDIEE